MLISFDNDNNNILPTLYSELFFYRLVSNSHQGNELSNPTEWEKWTFDDDDDDDDFCLLTF